ncbi:DeoR/GlpR family DNA-binding transcription regulator [Enterobacter sp.]|uniref:DeoR/GlpR family DNA-binding transcription regulator n=1 Tax=Enterobacter sp. TaxID=42895 RepID=UPI00296F4E8D|nr:DeoR/GlpR family DNA-binding transcription regulator [Enterobacter sp.]
MFDYAEFPEQRQEKIKQLLALNGKVVCAQLATELNVSEHTIRRDLKELANLGLCKRVYGGAVSMLPPSGNFLKRENLNSDKKEQLARRAVSLIKPESCVFFDAGTTNLAIARQLPPGIILTAVTNSPLIAAELMHHEAVEIIFPGGRINKETGGATGIDTLRHIEKMFFDQCLLGACAFDADEGVTVFEYDDAEFKKCLVTRSSDIIVTLTADKIATLARYQVATSEEITTLVIDDAVSEQALKALRSKKLDVILAG